MKEYRIPKIEEFVQGFKYQVAHDQGMIIWDPATKSNVKSEMSRIWFDREVYWMCAPKEFHTEKYGENTVTIDSNTYDFFYRTEPYVIEDMLEQGLIRTGA